MEAKKNDMFYLEWKEYNSEMISSFEKLRLDDTVSLFEFRVLNITVTGLFMDAHRGAGEFKGTLALDMRKF